MAIDSSLQLAVIYREMDRPQESQALLDVTNKQNALQNEFQRFCHFKYLRALLKLDNEVYPATHVRLKSLLYQATVRKNKELLCVRLTLASMLRNHGKTDEAAMLVDDIVSPAVKDTDSNGSLIEESDTE